MAYTLEVDKKDSIAKPALMLYDIATKKCKEVISGPKGSKIKLPEFSKVNTLAFFASTVTSKAAKKEISLWHYDILSGAL